MKISVLLPLSIISFFSFSQNDIDDTELENRIKILCKNDNSRLHKLHSFFFNKEIDSSYVLSGHMIVNNEVENHKIGDYVYYIHAHSTLQKGFFAIAKAKLENNISASFSYQHLIDYDLGYIALVNQEYEKAIHYFDLALNSNGFKSSKKIKNIYHNIGISNLHLKNYPQSETYLQKELDIALEEKDTSDIIYGKVDLANLFYQQYKDDIAISYFKDAYDLAQLFSEIKAKQITAENMAIVEKNRKHYKESIVYYEEQRKWKDSLWNRDKISQLLEKDKAIAVAVKDKEIGIQKEIAKQQRERSQLLIMLLIAAVLFSAMLYYFYRIKTKQHALIQTQKQQLEDLDQTKNYFFSVMSHDLRSPISSLIRHHSKLKQHLNNKALADATKVADAALHLTSSIKHLLNNVLHWSLEQNEQLLFHKEKQVLHILIQHVVADFKALATIKNIPIVVDLDNTIVVDVDKESFKIVLRNFLDNAIKYTPQNGTIEVRTTKTHTDTCAINIKNSGEGIPEDQLAKIKALETLSIAKIDRSKGIGLGLLLCTSLIKKNNGTFTIESILNTSTTVTIVLPTTNDRKYT